MIRISIVFLFLCSLFGGQGSDLELIREIKKKNVSFTTDRLGQLYLINPYSITMYSKSGDSLREFNSRKYGNISFVDATDPYKILVFFQDYNLIVFLDNFLSVNGSAVDLQELGYDQISFACQSREKGMWLFDPLKQKLLKLNSDFKVSDESINLGQWFGRSLQPDFMQEQNNQLYLKAEDSPFIYVFDHFGTYLKKIELPPGINCQLLEGNINYLYDSKFCQYSTLNLESECREISQKKANIARIEKGRFYLGSSSKVSIYKTN